ncbi:MAG: hypothetical protein PHR36_05475, partial [Patescibacteria group bacterium]|nr:hypothetical protein [Patescibacteria group bacterium]
GVHEFLGPRELADALVVFAAMQSKTAFNPAVREIWMNARNIQEPSVRQGLGPDTTMVIGEVEILE